MTTRRTGSMAAALLMLILGGVPASEARAGEPAMGDLEQGVALFRTRDFTLARPFLERAVQADPKNLDVKLLLGITEYRLAHPGAAESLLRAAEASTDAETAASARFFLGLIAAERGDDDTARSLLSALAGSTMPVLADSSRAVLERVSRKTLTAFFMVRPEFDSNVKLLPIAPQAQNTTDGRKADGDLLMLASLVYRPFANVGLSFDEIASYRQQFQLLDYSIFGNTLGARYAYLARNDRVSLSYAFEAMTLGGSLLTLGQVAEAGYRRRVVADFWLGARYLFRYREYFQDGFAPFTGPSYTGAVDATWGAPERAFEVSVGYFALRETTDDPTYTATGQGARLYMRRRFGRRVELAVNGWAIYRTFDESDAIVGSRRDTQLYGDVTLGFDLHRHVGLVVGGSVLRNFSSDPSFDYLKITGYLGVAFAFSGP